MAKFFARLSQAFRKNKSGSIGIGIGTILDQRYRLESELGRGGMGIVYRAHDIPNDREVAVKFVDLDAANALTLQQFLREAEITARLRHPHIVAVYETGAVDTGLDQPSPFLVMELVQGVHLNEIQWFTCNRIVEIGKQICEALGYIHDLGFLYRDLKPGNVILQKCGFQTCVKLLDFGLARLRGEAYLPTESTRAGTVFYLAPELIVGEPADVGSDLYALGATLYEMITGRAPFSNIDEQTILSQHLNDVVSPPSHSRSDLPPALEAIILRLLEKNPKDRFASAQEVEDALEQVTCTPRSAVHGNLPQTDFAADDDELAQVITLLPSSQLVTLLNDNETLALAVGIQLMDQFVDGVWLVQMETVAEPAMVLQTIASVFDVRETPNRSLSLSLIETLREKSLLLLLSHCGHLAAACGQLAITVMRACPEVHILAISNQPLNVPGERCFRGVVASTSSVEE